MAVRKWTVVKKDKKRVRVKDKTGKEKTLLTPTGKVAKYKAEMKNGVCITNDGKRKKDEKGREKKLTKAQRAYRAGYVNALGEQSAIYKKKQKAR